MKELVRMSDLDVLCFLEGKTDIQHLTQLDGVEEWVAQTGYKHLHCYWFNKEVDGIIKKIK